MRSENHAARSAFRFLAFRRATSCMTDPIGKRSDDVEQVSGRAHQPIEARDNQPTFPLNTLAQPPSRPRPDSLCTALRI